MENKIHTYRLRYLVPFTFQNYRKLYNALKASEDWSITNARQKQEQDVYSFVLDSFSAKESETHPGSAWLLSSHKKKERLPVLSYHKKGDAPLKLTVTEVGLFLFQSRVGFFWYEIQMGKEIAPAKLVEIQNQIKELNRHPNLKRFFLITKENICFELEKDAFSEKKPEETGWIYFETTSPCYIKQSALRPMDDSKSTETDMLPSHDDLEVIHFYPDPQTGKYIFSCNSLQRFSLGNWIASLLYALSSDIVFFAEKKNCLCDTTLPLPNHISYPANVPDKALLFTYAVFSIPSADADLEAQFLETVYQLTNGYKKSYQMATGIKSDMYRPFQNAVWYATREGCGYFIKSAETAPQFFRYNMKRKVINDYFFLYVILLYQSYSLLRFSKSVAEELSAVPNTYASGTGNSIDTLQKLNCEINTFLVKGVHTSVSSINHQNLFFRYVMQALDIEADIKSITMGLDALLKLQNEIEKKQALAIEKEEEEARRTADDAMNSSLGLLSMLAIISAFTDSLGLIAEINDILSNRMITPKNIIGLIVFVLLAALILRISRPAIKFYWHRHREQKKNAAKNTR